MLNGSVERWQRIERLLDGALERGVDEREAWLRAECAGDDGLFREVAALIEAGLRDDDFLAAAAAECAADLIAASVEAEPVAPVSRQERIGPFRIVREIGRGGMGTVFLAERDVHFQQRVALKVIRPGLHLDDDLVRRFIDERQIQAGMEHANIARLVDGGLTDAGDPWFAMEYVEGQPIDRWCDAHCLTVDARLELFCTVCDAVEYAHRRQVVHRDLKPSNILVRDDGVLKLLDFGVARLLAADAGAREAVTRPGSRLLTPEYASPEQIRGDDISPASDVYSLGVLLYELLAGRRPYRVTGSTPAALEQAVLTQEPVRPSTAVGTAPDGAPAETTTARIAQSRAATPERLRHRLRGDLDAIVLHALAKDPAQRYATVAALAADVRHHLEGAATRAPSTRESPASPTRPARALAGVRLPQRIAGTTLHRALLDHRAWWIGTALAIAAATLVITRVLRPGPSFDPDWVIVAPLENRTHEPALDDVGVMAAEWVTQGLARTGLVRVVDGQTMIALAREVAGSDRPIRALAERTGAGTVISGSYYREGDRLRFQTRITDARTGRLVRDVDAVLASVKLPTDALEPLRERITGALAVLRDDRLGNATAIASQPPLYPAYQEFLLGMATFGGDYDASIRHFTAAASLDSTFGQALLWAGQSYANVGDYPHADSIFRLLEADRSRLPPYDEANFDYFYLGFVRGDWSGAYEGARRMVQLAPAAPHALFALGTTATIENRPAEALRALQVIDIDRGWGRDWALRVLTLRARAYHQLGDHEHELIEARRLREREPNMGWTRIPEIRALAALGRTEEVERAVDAGLSFPPTPRTWEAYSGGELLFQAGLELSAHGHPDAAKTMLDRAVAWYRERTSIGRASAVDRTGLAGALLAAGRLDEARAEYEALLSDDSLSAAVLGSLGVIAAHQNRIADARSKIEILASDHRPWTFGRPALGLARIHAALGDMEAAVRYIRDARRAGFARIYFLHLEPEFAALASFPPWQSLLAPTPAAG